MIATETYKPLEINLSQKQDWFIFNEKKYPAFIGGLGSGKTYAGCIKALLKSHHGQKGMVIAPTFTMLRDVTLLTFIGLLEAAGARKNWEYYFNKTEGILTFKNSTIIFRSADEPERLRGVNLNWAYLDEAALMSEDVWKIILGRLRIGEKPQAWITTTPAGFNWVYDYWVEKGNENYGLTHASTREAIWLPKEYLQDLEDNYTGEFAKQEIDGEFVAFEGLVYPEFSRNQHIYKDRPLPESWQRVRAIDYGYTNPFVCLWGAVDGDGRLYIYDEHYQRKMLIRDHARIIKRRPGEFSWTVSDHDAQDNAEMRAEGIDTYNAKKDIIPGIQKVKARLKIQPDGWPRLMISEKCINTIKELSMYRWNEAKTGKNEKEEPVKEFDHAMDALRYMIMGLEKNKIIMSDFHL